MFDMLLTVVLFLLFLQRYPVHSFTKTTTDYDLYGIKVAMNDGLMISVDNLNMVWYATSVVPNSTLVRTIYYNETTCDFVYSVIVPVSNISSFVYNCIDNQGNSIVGFFTGNNIFSLSLGNEQSISNYSIQDNFVIEIDGQNKGVYGFADDFIFYYELNATFSLTIWPNTLNMSPRAVDIGTNVDYGVVVGYCQSTVSLALECGFIVQLNKSSLCPNVTEKFSIVNFIRFPYSDPRTNHHISHSRTYSTQTVLSVSIAWRTRRVLIGIPSLNIVLLYSFDDPQHLLGSRQNGIELMGFGKSVAWLDDEGKKAVIIANSYSYSTYQWFSSYVHVYDIQSDGFSDDTNPIFAYPNSQQILFPWTNPSLIRLVCSTSGHVAILDVLGNAAIIFSTPEGTFPNTNSPFYTSFITPCIRGTYRDYAGIELCFLCSNGTYSSNCSQCISDDVFCPSGSVEEISYSAFESIEQDQDYPESPENTVFDDILMENMFSFSTGSTHCLLVSPITWVFVVIVLGIFVAICVTIHEIFCPGAHKLRDWTKQILRKVDLIGEGELWIGGLVSAAVTVLIISAYVFSTKYMYRYPVEQVSGDSSFACHMTMLNAKFSTTAQKRPNSRSPSKDIQTMFDMLNSQLWNLNIDLVQTSFTCNDSLIVQRLIGSTSKNLSISSCQSTHNDSILSLVIPLPTHGIDVHVSLLGLKTVGAIRLGLSGSSAVSTENRYTLMALNFASTFVPTSLDQVLATSTTFSLELTQIINRTAPLFNNGLAKYSAIWSSSYSVNADELFSEETRYTLFRRTHTNITINIAESIFYISNAQEPITRQTEVIFRNLLFTIVVLEVFGLLFLVIKLLLVPVAQIIWKHIHHVLKKNQVTVFKDGLASLSVHKINSLMIQKSSLTMKARRRWSTITGRIQSTGEHC